MNAISGVEDIATILNAGQQGYMVRYLADPSTIQDIWDEATRSKLGKPWIGKEKDT